MKLSLPFLLVLTVLALLADVASAQSVPPASVASLQTIYEDKVKLEVSRPHELAVADLNTKFAAALDRAQETAQKAGNLEDAVAIRKEREAVLAGGYSPSAVEDPKTPAGIKTLHITYRNALVKLELERDKKWQPLKETLNRSLSGLIDALTKSGKLDEALAAKKMLDSIGTTIPSLMSLRESGGASDTTDKLQKGGGKAGDMVVIALAPKMEVSFIWCPSGNFEMGSPKDELGRSETNEQQVPVELSKGFWICVYECRQKDWQAAMGENPSEVKGENLPVTNVGWNDAVAFCAKLNGLGLLPSSHKFSLPSEAQWEYACRAGTKSALSNGKELTGLTTCTNLDDIAWYRLNSGEKLHPVGEKRANRWGAHDMLGNAWEWCLDSYDDKLIGGKDPVNRSDSTKKASRGGAWWAHSKRSRSADRGSSDADYRFGAVGFRLAIITE